MKKIQFLTLILGIILFSSCSDTVVIENDSNSNNTEEPISGYFKKRVLIEDYTGTWCGNCTRVSYAIERVLDQTGNVVPVAIHNGNDPYNFEGIAPLKNLICPNNALALPVSRLNRTGVWTFPETSNIPQAVNLTGKNGALGLSMNSRLVGNTINLDVNVKFAEDYSNLKLVVYLLEDGLIYEQTNYTTYYGGLDLIPNFVHNHVLRTSMTDILGESIGDSNVTGSTFTKSFSITVPSSIENTSNISFAAFIVGSDNKAINARASHINQNQEFEVNP